MLSRTFRQWLGSLSLLVAVGFGAVAPANAIIIGGAWDPRYGSPFLADGTTTTQDMWWSGSALFNLADTVACAATASNNYLVTSANCSSMFVSNAQVLLSEGPGGNLVDTLNFSATVALTQVKFANDGKTVLWVESAWWDPLALGTSSKYTLSNYLFSLAFAQTGADLFHTSLGNFDKHGGHGPSGKTFFWNGNGNGHIGDLCSPTNTKYDTDPCGFADIKGTMVFTSIPEPSTYALVLAAFAALGVATRRRRQLPA